MCAKISKKAAIKKGTVRLAPAATPSKNTARKSTGVRSRADRAAESDYSDEDIERIDPDESASSNDEVEEDFLNLREYHIWLYFYRFPQFTNCCCCFRYVRRKWRPIWQQRITIIK